MSISNKLLYKLEIKSTKYLPIVISILYIANTILGYFDIEVAIISMLGGMSFLPLLKFYLSSFTYKLCTHHRMFIYYIFTLDIIECIDYYVGGLPISDMGYLLLIIILFGIFLILYIIFKRRYDFSKKHGSKIPERDSP